MQAPQQLGKCFILIKVEYYCWASRLFRSPSKTSASRYSLCCLGTCLTCLIERQIRTLTRFIFFQAIIFGHVGSVEFCASKELLPYRLVSKSWAKMIRTLPVHLRLKNVPSVEDVAVWANLMLIFREISIFWSLHSISALVSWHYLTFNFILFFQRLSEINVNVSHLYVEHDDRKLRPAMSADVSDRLFAPFVSVRNCISFLNFLSEPFSSISILYS